MKGKGKYKVSSIGKSAMDGNSQRNNRKNKNADLDDTKEIGNKVVLGSSNEMGTSVLHSVKWDCIILDEVCLLHYIFYGSWTQYRDCNIRN